MNEDATDTTIQATSDQANGLQKGRLEQQMTVKFRSWIDTCKCIMCMENMVTLV